MEFDENLQLVLSRISSYICKGKNEFQLTNNDTIQLTNYTKIQKLFVWDGFVDLEAIKILSKLCQKRGINDFLELDCAIKFQLGGKHKEIGISSQSSISTDQQKFLYQSLLPKLSSCTTKDDAIVVLSSSILIVEEIPSSPPILNEVKNQIFNAVGIKRASDFDNILIDI
jgi:hypothetical protein